MNPLEVQGISKRYRLGSKVEREIWALDDVSFSVAPRTILGVIGPNGAGKTTLLKVISRVTRPTSGTVTGRGRVVPLLALGAGFRPELSGRENVFLNAAMYGIPASVVEARLDDIVEFAGIPDFFEVPVKRYSSGMYLRLAFSVAINMRPDILLADEVLAVGDLEFQERCLERVQREGQAGMSVLFVSHDMEQIRRLCDQVLWLNAGRIVAMGPADEVTAAYEKQSWSQAAGANGGRGQSGARSRFGRILFGKLMVAGREIGAARVSDELVIVIGLQISEQDISVRPQIDVKARGALAFRSTVTEPIKMGDKGFFTATVVIPPHLLAETVYSVDIAVGLRRGEDESHPVVLSNALAFNVYDPDEDHSARGAYRGQMRGVVQPRLAWSLGPAEGLEP
jgi:ABC-type polysaccharide/polyol phosphate transport system ATPase subunit